MESKLKTFNALTVIDTINWDNTLNVIDTSEHDFQCFLFFAKEEKSFDLENFSNIRILVHGFNSILYLLRDSELWF